MLQVEAGGGGQPQFPEEQVGQLDLGIDSEQVQQLGKEVFVD